MICLIGRINCILLEPACVLGDFIVLVYTDHINNKEGVKLCRRLKLAQQIGKSQTLP